MPAGDTRRPFSAAASGERRACGCGPRRVPRAPAAATAPAPRDSRRPSPEKNPTGTTGRAPRKRLRNGAPTPPPGLCARKKDGGGGHVVIRPGPGAEAESPTTPGTASRPRRRRVRTAPRGAEARPGTHGKPQPAGRCRARTHPEPTQNRGAPSARSRGFPGKAVGSGGGSSPAALGPPPATARPSRSRVWRARLPPRPREPRARPAPCRCLRAPGLRAAGPPGARGAGPPGLTVPRGRLELAGRSLQPRCPRGARRSLQRGPRGGHPRRHQ